MANNDIGIDLGTTKTIIYINGEIVLNEPSVVAYDAKTGDAIAFGDEAFLMVGKTNSKIAVEYPLIDGVISNYTLTKEMVKHFILKTYKSKIAKPRICICVPSQVTGIEENAVIDAAVSVGARQVFLIEEPIAGAIGMDIDILKAEGNMIVDIGGGTTDIAVVSLGGIVCSKSIKVAGNSFDKELIKKIRSNLGFLIGQKTAAKLKHEIASAVLTPENENKSFTLKGLNLLKGIPGTLEITTKELYPIILPIIQDITMAIKQVLEVTPPELSGDIYESGIILTGAGARFNNLDKFIQEELKVNVVVSQNSEVCVAVGTGRAFEYEDKLESGFRNVTPGVYNK